MSLRQHTGSTVSNVTLRDIARMSSNSDRTYPSKRTSLFGVGFGFDCIASWWPSVLLDGQGCYITKTYTEDDVQAAIAYYRAGHCCNISQIADKFGVKRSTLHNPLQGIHGPASHS